MSRINGWSVDRPASTGVYFSSWENKLEELVELLTRSSLETHKLDLMAEISSLKNKLALTEKERRELDERLQISQRHISEMDAKMSFKDSEINELRQRCRMNGTILNPDSSGDSGKDRTIDRERTLDRLKRKQTEVEKLKKAVESLLISNDDKDKRLDEMRRLVRRYRKVEEMLIQAQGRKAVEELMLNAEDDTSSTSSSTTPSVGEIMRDNLHNMDDLRVNTNYLSSPTATSTPVTSSNREALGMTRSNSCEHLIPKSQLMKTPPTSKKKFETQNNGGFGTLPKERYREGEETPKRTRGFPTLGRTLLRIRSGKRSCSAPNLAHSEVVTDDEDGLQHFGTNGIHQEKKRRGLRKLFGKLKRSSSQDFDGDKNRQDEFKRGGVRATATARLGGWSQQLKTNINDLDIPFARWDGDRVTAWLNDIGLNMYLVDCKRWVKNGEQLLRASPLHLEKEMGMKNGLHRKKLQLALQVIGSESNDRLSDLDHNWVTRWLDDIGLPQYKDSFYDARIDGRMLHYMTVDDLLALRVSNELHHISIKRGIQVLRLNNFDPQCLRRRPSPDEILPGDVMSWTTHRVMEWLRTIDLSEYAPNLRGSGVHGGIMVLEPRFTAELFSQLLSIPHTKTLLKRHLNTHFVALIGNGTQQKKREYEATVGYVPLLPSSKIKRGKFALFGHKRTKSETEADGFICPMDIGKDIRNGNYGNGTNGNFPHKDDKAAKEIGAFSKEINTLTNMLAQDRFYEVQTSNV
ncbi:liprin-beta-1-like isoform X4 [Patella vulgata]|uniref:liprin-beta-1-like isoform X4 n=1 Tax=Patella vulgata TaxID=6465 RepID=UPI0024A91873|nr:liprin-beta-1-like isoform X4 [Patella vulgata]